MLALLAAAWLAYAPTCRAQTQAFAADSAEPALDAAAARADDDAKLPGTASLDTSSLTTDPSINTPTTGWTRTHQSPSQVSALNTSLGARIAEIPVESMAGSEPRFAVRLVKNSGAYAATGGWRWYTG